MYTGGNWFLNGAEPSKGERDFHEDKEHRVTLSLEEREDGVYLETDLFSLISSASLAIHSTASLGKAFESEEGFENPDGSEIILDRDYFGNDRGLSTLPGPSAVPLTGSSGRKAGCRRAAWIS